MRFKKAARNYEMDMTSGPILKKLLIFSLPLMLTGILQLLYNAADIVVVGRFAGSEAMAAVGSTASLINLTVNLFIGLSVGASVSVANHYGAGRYKEVNEAVHTSIGISLVAGVAVGIFGIFMARNLLHLTGTPDDVIDQGAAYLTIYFAGMPASMIYNFGAAILRAVGDTRRPLYYLTISGLANVVFNLISVIVFGMGAAGVALATVISQVISAALIVSCLCFSHGPIHLRPREIRIKKDRLLEIARVGLPAGIQSTVFSISNVMIQSSVNSFGSITMAGNAAGSNLDSFVNTATSAVSQAALSFTGQNMGAHNYKRVGLVLRSCSALVTAIGLVLGFGVIALGHPLLSIYTSDAQVIEQGLVRLRIMCSTYFICALMDTFACTMRGMGYSFWPMVVTLLGVVGIRVTWLMTVFAANHTLFSLYLSYPVSWGITVVAHATCFFVLYRKLLRTHDASETA